MPINPQPSLVRLAKSDGSAPNPTELNLGERVRALRKARNWTLEQAAQKAGLARSTLSKIENGQMSPTFDAVKKLAEGLNISVPQLFTAPHDSQILGRMDITRKSRGKPHTTATYEHELLGAGLKSKQMIPYRTHIRARSIEEFDGWVRHDGEEFLYVLSGEITFYSEFYEPITLQAGDSAYYDAAMGHNVCTSSPEDATILWVTSLTN